MQIVAPPVLSPHMCPAWTSSMPQHGPQPFDHPKYGNIKNPPVQCISRCGATTCHNHNSIPHALQTSAIARTCSTTPRAMPWGMFHGDMYTTNAITQLVLNAAHRPCKLLDVIGATARASIGQHSWWPLRQAICMEDAAELYCMLHSTEPRSEALLPYQSHFCQVMGPAPAQNSFLSHRDVQPTGPC